MPEKDAEKIGRELARRRFRCCMDNIYVRPEWGDIVRRIGEISAYAHVHAGYNLETEKMIAEEHSQREY